MIVTWIRLGIDLRIAIRKNEGGYRITATDVGGAQLAVLGVTVAYPSDAEFSAMRATAIMLFPERITQQPNVPAEPPVKPHDYERQVPGKRDPVNPWACKHCQYDARHPAHTAPRTA